MNDFLQDLRYGLRGLRRNPSFAVVAVLTLALGIGANSAIFSVVDSVLLQPLPYQGAAGIVYVWETRDGTEASASAPDFVDWRAQARSFEALGASQGATYTYTGGGEPERLRARRASVEFFAVLGLRATHGRLFVGEDDRYGGPKVAVLGHGFWTRRFGADPAVVGRTISLSGEPYTVVGILEPHVRLTEDVWVPLALPPSALEATGTRAYTVLGRLKAGVTLAQAQAEMEGIAARLITVRPWSNTGWGVSVVPIRDQILGDGARIVLILFGAVGCVLLIACANVANLLLAKSLARRREVGVRFALGAGRARIARQFLAEAFVLTAAGAGTGLLAAYWGLDLLVSLLPADLPRLSEITMRPGVLWFTVGLAGLVGLVFALVPAVFMARGAAQDAMREGDRGGTGRQSVLRRALVVAEVGLAVMLVAAAGLLVRSFGDLMAVRPGVDADRVLAVQLALPVRYATPEQMSQVYEDVVERVRTVPGVAEVAASGNVPLTGDGPHISFFVEGRPTLAPEDRPVALWQVVGADYFRVLGVPVGEGRAFESSDRQDTRRVAVINETMARRVWPSESPLGQRVTLDDGAEGPAEIVGVVADVRHRGPAAPPEPEIYLSVRQLPPGNWQWFNRSPNLLVRTAGAPADLAPAVRAAVWSVDRDIGQFNLRTLTDVRGASMSATRGLMVQLGVMAAVALALAAIGIYGVIAFSVGQRTRELGIRMTLGARQADVVRLVLRQGLALIVVGAGMGLAGAIAATRVLRNSLFGVTPTDPLTFAAATLLLVAVAMLACYAPARRAARVDPMEALRYE